MNVLGVYIYNSTTDQWLVDDGYTRREAPVKVGEPQWGDFSDAHEYPAEAADYAEEIRELVSGEDTTFTMAALH